jgi:pimeloyl-ACP methyl ester carboxylesterase
MSGRVRQIGWLLGAFAAGYGAERLAMRSVLGVPDPAADEDWSVPAGAQSHTFPSHDDGEIHTVEVGSGRPLVLVHGVTLSHRLWHYQLHGLSDRYRVIAVDQRGHGKSVAGGNGYGLDLLAHDIADVLERLEVEGAIVVGHSMGGMALMQFCADHEEVLRRRVAGLVFLSTFSKAPPAMARLMRPAADGGRPQPVIPPRLAPHFSFPPSDLSFLIARRSFGKRPSPTHVRVARTMHASLEREASYLSWMGICLHDATESLSRIDLPSVVVVGTEDRLTPVAEAQKLAGHIPGSQLIVVPDLGHMIMLEDPDRLAEVIDKLAADL